MTQIQRDTTTSRKLYEELIRSRYNWHPYERDMDRGEDMEILSQLIAGYWRERFLINHADRRAYELMDENLTLKFIDRDDIDWMSVETLPNNNNANTFSACYPLFSVGKFKDGVALVEWTLYPDGMYFMDEDGYGGEDNKASILYGYINRYGRLVERFQAKSREQMERMRDNPDGKLYAFKSKTD